MDTRPLRTASTQGSVYNTLLYTVFQQPHEGDAAGTVIALSASNPGEGVTHVARELVKEMGKSNLTSVAGINTRFLRRLHEPTMEAFRKSIYGSASGSKGNIWEAGAPDASLVLPEGHGPWDGSWQYRRDCINLLRSEFDHTIIDCPSLRESGDLLSVAPFVDGVILVIEANRTRREQLWHAEQSITAARGKLLGYILNKRTYDVPGWLYRKL
jgi:Mrp family chromosome partitioning ATPase